MATCFRGEFYAEVNWRQSRTGYPDLNNKQPVRGRVVERPNTKEVAKLKFNWLEVPFYAACLKKH